MSTKMIEGDVERLVNFPKSIAWEISKGITRKVSATFSGVPWTFFFFEIHSLISLEISSKTHLDISLTIFFNWFCHLPWKGFWNLLRNFFGNFYKNFLVNYFENFFGISFELFFSEFIRQFLLNFFWKFLWEFCMQLV